MTNFQGMIRFESKTETEECTWEVKVTKGCREGQDNDL